jgi:arylsulfatase A-like enzyme
MMSRTAGWLCPSALAVMFAFAAAAAGRTSAGESRARSGPVGRPSVVLILADDLGYAELGCYGQGKIRTPCLDRMAAEGLRFTRFYAGSPVCAPSRCSLMTGKHGGHAWVRDNRDAPPSLSKEEFPGQVPLPDRETTLAELFKRRGYATAAIGKWGLGPPGSEGDPQNQGFDHFLGYYCQGHAHNHYPRYLYEGGIRVPLIAWWPGKIRPGTVTDVPGYFPDLMPTLMELIGAADQVPKDSDGISLPPTLLGEPRRQRTHDHMVWEFNGYGGQQAVLLGNWKGIRRDMHKGNTAIELYNLADDPGERHDISSRHPEIVRWIAAIMANDRIPSKLFPLPIPRAQ